MTSIICIGDFGSGQEIQYRVSQLIKYLNNRLPCELVLGLGDNIYPTGVKCVNDNNFIDKFEKPYSILPEHIKFYNCLGNHDYYGGKKSIKSQINYTQKSNRWVLPSNYYCFGKIVNGISCDFFVIDTNLYEVTDNQKEQKKQEKWIIEQLGKSKARWRIVYGHHPWKSCGVHGNCGDKLDEFYSNICKTNKVDIIINGHDHDQQHLYIPDIVNLVVSGTGGKTRYMPEVIRDLSAYKYVKLFSCSEAGCVELIPTQNNLLVNFHTIDGDMNHQLPHNFSITNKRISK